MHINTRAGVSFYCVGPKTDECKPSTLYRKTKMLIKKRILGSYIAISFKFCVNTIGLRFQTCMVAQVSYNQIYLSRVKHAVLCTFVYINTWANSFFHCVEQKKQF